MVLDVPCGVGWGSSMLSTAKHVVAMDISQEAVTYGSTHYAAPLFAVGHMAKLPFNDDLFDVVICLEGLEHVPGDLAIYK